MGEPSGWEIEATDTSIAEPGVLQLRWARASAATDAREVLLDDLMVSDPGPGDGEIGRREAV